jgi:glycosyltransferase involved in cell wall biosynthesis
MNKMAKIQISVALATFNEETNIGPCIESLKQFATEIIIADGSSTDDTVQIAKKFGAKVINTSNKPMFHINKNLAIDNCTNDWIMLMDADERVSKSLAAEIKDVVNSNPSENGFWVNRRNWFLGGYLKKGGAYPDSVIRLFRKGKGRLPEVSVHEQISINGSVGYLKHDLLHLADPTFSRYLHRANRYTTQTAQEIARKNPGTNPMVVSNYLFIKPLLSFLKIYFRHKGYKDGFRGFVWALFSGFHFFYSYVKYWKNKQKTDISQMNVQSV